MSNYLQEGVDADGGYLVPEEWDSRLSDTLNEENIMRSLATKITTSGLHRINLTANKPAAAWIEALISSAKQTCMDIIRTDDEPVLAEAENGKIAVMFTAAYLYEHREEADHHALTLTLRALLFGQREEAF